jgi:hypothetical protein
MAEHLPRSSRGQVPRRVLLLALLPAALAACGGDRGPQRFLARKAVLERQVEDLRRLVRAAEQGGLLPKDKLVVGVSEQLANELARLALPREQVVGGRYRVRLERADVRFRDEHGSVRFHGKVGPAEGAEPAFFAELALFGVVDTVEVDRDTGVLRCNVSFVGFELKRFDAYGESETGRLLIEELGRQGLDALKALAFPIAIPVRLEQEIALNRVAREGPVRLLPASLPLRLTVTDVAAFGGRLWVAVDVTTRPPSKKAAGAPLAATPGAEER